MSDQRRALVLIVNFRSSAHLDRCLDSLQGEHVAAIHVLDNGSGSDERRELERVTSTRQHVVVHHSEENLGFGAGVNRLFRLAQPEPDEPVWLLNPDTVVASGATARLLRCLERHPGGLASPLLVAGEPGASSVWFAGGDVDVRRGRVVHRWAGTSVADLPTPLPPSTFLTAAALMCTAGTFAALGGFREDLFMYWEDVDLSLRASAEARPLVTCVEAVVWHLEGGSSGERRGRSALYYRYNARNRIVVTAPRTSPARVLLGAGAGGTARSLAAPLLRERHGRMRKAAAAARGMLEGLAAVRREAWSGAAASRGGVPE